MNETRKTINVAEPVHRILKVYAEMTGNTIAGILTELAEQFLEVIKKREPELYKELRQAKGCNIRIFVDD